MNTRERFQLVRFLLNSDVPTRRMDIDKPENVRWLQRNLWINNPYDLEIDRLLNQRLLETESGK